MPDDKDLDKLKKEAFDILNEMLAKSKNKRYAAKFDQDDELNDIASNSELKKKICIALIAFDDDISGFFKIFFGAYTTLYLAGSIALFSPNIIAGVVYLIFQKITLKVYCS